MACERKIEHEVLAKEYIESDLSALKDLHPSFLPRQTPAVEAAARILGHSDGENVL